MLRDKRTQRGSTVVELLAVMVVLSLLMTILVAAVSPVLRAQNRTQAKVDTVQTAAAALYRIQRDLRQTYYKSTWACTTGSSATCSQPAAFGTTPAIAFPTAYLAGKGQFQLQTTGPTVGQPNWQGVMVYWVDAAGSLNWAFDVPASFVVGSNGLSSASASQAVSDATTGVVSSMKMAASIQQLAVAINPSTPNMISLKLQAQSTENGNLNETTYLTNVLARQ